MKIIINADDLGFSQEVNDCIKKGLSSGRITSSTIMANGNAFIDAISIAKQFSNASFGVHLCLDELNSLTKSPVLLKYRLIDANGRFIKSAYLNVSYSDELLGAIYEEWRAQILKIKNEGVNISHLDSHHHCHTIPALYSVLVKLSSEFNIKKIRLKHTKSIYQKYLLKQANSPIIHNSNPRNKRSIVNKIISFVNQQLYIRKFKRDFVTTEYFFSLMYYYTNQKYFESYNSIELMCHPGHPAYADETKLLDIIDFKDAKLINYNQLLK